MPFILLICVVRYGLACLLCLVDMKLGVRIAITWFYVLGIAILGGILTLTANSWIVTIPASPSDEITISPISTAFCQSLTFTTDVEDLIDFYALTKPIQIDTNNIVKFSTGAHSCITTASYEYWGFYLLEGSNISLTFDASSGPPYFYAIQGEDNFKTWKDNMDCPDCYIGKSYAYSDTYTLTVTETNQYYFAFANEVHEYPCSDFTVNFLTERTRYKLSNAEMLCKINNYNSCTVNFPISGSRVVVVDIPENVPFDSEIDVVCNPRLYMYIVVFGMCPLLAGGIVTYILCRIKKRKQVSVNTASNDRPTVVARTDERQAILARVQSYVKVLRPVPPPDRLEEIN